MIRLKEVRTRMTTLTQEQLAERLKEHGVEITAAALSNVENGNKPASDRLLTAWALALGLDPLLIWQGPLRKAVEPRVPFKQASGL